MVLWLERPPYLRWLAAGLLLVAGLYLDLADRATEPYPFTVVAVGAGDAVDDAMIEWREVPVGLLGPPAAPGGAAVRSLDPGDPLTASTLTAAAVVPPGWWSVPMERPESVAAGSRVRLISADPPLDAEGVVTAPPTRDTFSVVSPGLVAVPADQAASAAQASQRGTLTVLLGN